MSEYLGETAALVTSICWAMTGIFFTIAGRRVGSWVVNLSRLGLAVIVLAVVHRALRGVWLPAGVELDRLGWLALSGVIGLALGDAALFQGLVYVGPRLTSLMMATVPLMSTILAWVLLGERLRPVDFAAVFLTTAGIAWVVSERRNRDNGAVQQRDLKRGILFALGGALGQSLGLITSRLGLVDDYSPLSATLIRMIAATAAFWGFALLAGHAGRALDILRADRRAVATIVGGTLVGPVLGVVLSLVAIQHAQIGIASTLMSLTPIVMLPMVWMVFREQISLRAVGGTTVALLGVAAIFLL